MPCRPHTRAPCLLSPDLQPPVLHGMLVVGRVLLADTQHLDGVGTWPLCPLPTPGAVGGGGLVVGALRLGGLPHGGWASPLQPGFGLGGSWWQTCGCLESGSMVLSCPTSHFTQAYLKLSRPHRGGDVLPAPGSAPGPLGLPTARSSQKLSKRVALREDK